ncbi:MAG: PIN domain-containing protein [Bryobacterales bacterium]|nr:PIN domain-containing protein [Bryobacterales bacterium]MBV9402066.1 PIN domain-containing protein [Bryobacterales bacterium]
MSRIFFDTNLFIYLLEDFGDRAARVRHLLERMSARRDELLTSTLTLAEVLVKPLGIGDIALTERYEKLLSGPGISVIPFERACARIYAQLRKDKSLKAPDVVQLACAASARCDLFITNDDRLTTKIVPGIQFIASLDRAVI